jgi:type IV secretory pathway VirB3-like protein
MKISAVFIAMGPQFFAIKSLWIQNTIMLSALGLVLFFIFYFMAKRKPRHILAAVIWLFIVLWFFNSPFFGFSTVTVNPQGIEINYGVLSLRNGRLPISAPWKIITEPSGIRKLKRIHLIKIGNHESMKVRGLKDLDLLKSIGAAIDEYKDLS